MEIRFGDHPSEESLERYLLHRSKSGELEVIETHVLGCPNCVERLEQAESFVTSLREAHKEILAASRPAELAHAWGTRIAAWLTPLRLSWTAALAILVAVLSFAPAQFALRWPVAPTQISLSAWRGAESVSVPSRHPLSVRLDSIDLPDGPVGVQLVDSFGKEVSHGSATIEHEAAQIGLPGLQKPGTYLLRLYSVSNTKSGQRDLLREFAFQAR